MSKLNYIYEYNFRFADTFGQKPDYDLYAGHRMGADNSGTGDLCHTYKNFIISDTKPRACGYMGAFSGFLNIGSIEEYRDSYLKQFHKNCCSYHDRISVGGIFCAGKSERITIFNVGDVRVYRYNGGSHELSLMTKDTLRIGGQKECPEVFIQDMDLKKIPVGEKVDPVNTLYIICNKRLVDALGEEEMCRIIREERETMESDSGTVADKILAASEAKGGHDICLYVVNVWASYEPYVDRRPRETCWNRDCEEWSTCNGRGCPGGNWHDI